jgi:hypothetical protein
MVTQPWWFWACDEEMHHDAGHSTDTYLMAWI